MPAPAARAGCSPTPGPAEVGGTVDQVQQDHPGGRERARGVDEAGPERCVLRHPAVEDLLDQDRHGKLARGGGERHHPGEEEALAQLRRGRHAAAQDGDRAGVEDVSLLGGRGGVRALLVAHPRGCGLGQHGDRGVVRIRRLGRSVALVDRHAASRS
jgi:hypothetical protein